MHVDDRLATVLAVRAAGENQVRVQYRQLLDLLGTTPANARSELLDAALLRLAELGAAIPVAERARAAAEPGLRLRNPRLVAELAHDHPRVAAAAMRNARLTEDQWLDLLPALSGSVRGQLRDRGDLGPRLQQRLDQLGDSFAGLPAGPEAAEAAEAVAAGEAAGNVHALRTVIEPAAATTAAEAQELSRIASGPDGIGAIVRRIAAYRRSREMATIAAANDAPQLPLTPEPAVPAVQAFAFACDPAGRICSADGTVAGMTVGLLLPFVGAPGNRVGEQFRRRQPIRLAPITLEGAPAISGDWILDATPEFDLGGRFTGYVGKLRRPALGRASGGNGTDSDRLRQLLHELRTPVNAIQGFSELIHQQLVGPVPHTYRAVAAGIAADAAQMLAGFDELERLVKLDSGALELPPGNCDLGAIVARTVARLEGYTAPRQSGFAVAPAASSVVAVAAPEAEQLLWRILATFAALAAPGEVLPLAFLPHEGSIVLEIAMPAALAALDEPLAASPPSAQQPVSGSLFGSGFALRLASAEAVAAGGELALQEGRALLLLPLAGPGSLTEPSRVSNPLPEVSALTAG